MGQETSVGQDLFYSNNEAIVYILEHQDIKSVHSNTVATQSVTVSHLPSLSSVAKLMSLTNSSSANSRTCSIYRAIYALPKCNLFPSAASLKSYIPEVFPVQQTKGHCASLPSI